MEYTIEINHRIQFPQIKCVVSVLVGWHCMCATEDESDSDEPAERPVADTGRQSACMDVNET